MGFTHYIHIKKAPIQVQWNSIIRDSTKLFLSLSKVIRKALINQGTEITKDKIHLACYESETFTQNTAGFIFHKTARTIGDEFIIGVFWLMKYHNPLEVEVSSDGQDYTDSEGTVLHDNIMLKAWQKYSKVFPEYTDYDREGWYFAKVIQKDKK